MIPIHYELSMLARIWASLKEFWSYFTCLWRLLLCCQKYVKILNKKYHLNLFTELDRVFEADFKSVWIVLFPYNLVFLNLIFLNLVFLNWVSWNLALWNMVFWNLVFWNMVFWNLSFWKYISLTIKWLAWAVSKKWNDIYGN